MSNLLLSNKFKMIGWCLLIPATILGIILICTEYDTLSWNAKVFAIVNDEFLGKTHYFKWIETNISNTLVGIIFITGALFVGFSREKQEDEFIARIRLSSLTWAVIVNYILLLLCFIFIYGTSFMNVMIYNMFTVLIIFIARFNYILFINAKSNRDEK